MHAAQDTAGHLESEEVAAYLDGGLSAKERARAESHLAECDICRAEVVEVSRLLATPAPARRPFPRWPAAALAAAAVIAMLFLLRPADVLLRPDTETLRVAEPAIRPDGVESIPVITPPADTPVPAEDLAFAWHSAEPEALYRFTLTEETGEVLWTVATSDTALALPGGLDLRAGGTYFWHVDALLPDGRSATTRVQRLTTRP
jgi:hypothetical protein